MWSRSIKKKNTTLFHPPTHAVPRGSVHYCPLTDTAAPRQLYLSDVVVPPRVQVHLGHGDTVEINGNGNYEPPFVGKIL